MGFRGYNNYSRYSPTSVAELQALAQESFAKLSKKNQLSPITIEGRTIANNWWGKAWCENLKKYADYDNRIDRGKSYVKNGLILDFKIKNGNIVALVQGSRKKPYEVNIFIDKCDEKVIKELQDRFSKEIETVDDLLNGNFPKSLGVDFLESKLFPTVKEIDYICSCPDYANLCKHVSCVLHGVGAKLDKDPEVLFTLRGIKVEDMVSKKLTKEVNTLINDEVDTKRKIIDDSDVNDLFDI